jgi:hypothetical protein
MIDGGVPGTPDAIMFTVCTDGRAVAGGDGPLRCTGVTIVGLVGLGMPRRRLFVFAEADTPRGLGLRLLKLPIGLVKPLRRPGSAHGATTEISSDDVREAVRISAALSRTEGTLCSMCSVPLLRGIRCGFGGWEEWGGEGEPMGSMSRSKMADDDEWLWSA